MEKQKPKVIITGAKGQIGRLLCADLAKEYEIVMIDKNAGADEACFGRSVEKNRPK